MTGEKFLSSDEYDDRAHQLYNEGQYDEAIETLREGLGLYPTAVELHVGMGYARLAREEYAWSRRSERCWSYSSSRETPGPRTRIPCRSNGCVSPTRW